MKQDISFSFLKKKPMINKIYEYDFSYPIWCGKFPKTYELKHKYFYLFDVKKT